MERSRDLKDEVRQGETWFVLLDETIHATQEEEVGSVLSFDTKKNYLTGEED